MSALTMGRVMLAFAGLGVVIAVAVAVMGYRVQGPGPLLIAHVSGALVALLLVLLSQLWVPAFVAGSLRLTRRVAPAVFPPRGTVGLGIVLPLLMVTFLSGAFVLGVVGLGTSGVLSTAHGIAGAGAAVLALFAVPLQNRALAALDRHVTAVDPGAPSREPASTTPL
jgi:hypothetical protein